jgi:hypothetical protein
MRKLLLIVALFVACSAVAGNPPGTPQTSLLASMEVEGSFSMILVPDPQTYSKFEENQAIFDLQTAWIARNIDRLNIRAALFTGDMVEQNNKLIAEGRPSAYSGNQTSRQQWEAVSHALKRLDHRIPYVVAQGNHDIGHVSAETRYTLAPEYIYPERNRCFESSLVATCANYEGVHTMENSAYEFVSDTWGKLLVVTFEFAPRDEALEWARGLIESKRYRDHRVIVLVHSWLDDKGNRYRKEGYKVRPCNWPEDVWRKLVEPSKNICLVLSGHAGLTPKIVPGGGDVDYRCSSSLRNDKAADGHNVPQMMFNAQQSDGSWFGNGGDGWLRILEFRPDGKTIAVRTFSPLFAFSPRTSHLAWRTADYDQYLITIDTLSDER